MIRKFTINGTEVEISFNAKTHRYTITINGVKNHSPSVSTILKLGDTFGIASAAGRKNYQDTLHEVLCVGEGTEFRDKDVRCVTNFGKTYLKALYNMMRIKKFNDYNMLFITTI